MPAERMSADRSAAIVHRLAQVMADRPIAPRELTFAERSMLVEIDRAMRLRNVSALRQLDRVREAMSLPPVDGVEQLLRADETARKIFRAAT